MVFFVIRRFAASIPIFVASSLLAFWLVTISGDPLAGLRESNDPNRDQTMAQLRQDLDLDTPFFERYFSWLTGVVNGDFGLNRAGQDVSALLSTAAAATFRLVIIATILGLVIGVFVGVIAAIRQYSTLDYSSTFAAFLFFSLPIFWLAVLLKQFGAIEFNDYLENPGISTTGIVAVAVLSGFVAAAIAGGSLARRAIAAGSVGLTAVIGMAWMDSADWLGNPGLSVLALVIGGIAAGLAATVLVAPPSERRVLAAGVLSALICVGLSLMLDTWIEEMTWTRTILAVLGVIAIGVAVGAALGGDIVRTSAMRAGAVAGFVAFLMIGFDRFLSAWVPGRTIGTIGPRTPNLDVPFWPTLVDAFGHQLLPTIAITLVGLAGYLRFTRSSMLETLNADYVRTAKAKGLPATQVVVRHALRTGLLPIVTLIAIDFAFVISGSVITEQVFGWSGMGQLFINGLREVDPYPVMGTLVILSGSVILMNALADVAYAYLDPRIRR